MRDRIIDWGERIILTLFFAAFAVTNARSGDWSDWMLVALEGLTVIFVLTRRSATSISDRPVDWALAMGGTFCALLARPESRHVAEVLAQALIFSGALVAALAKLSLNRRFGIAPANRGVQASWAYSLVRHPMYLGYIVAQVGYLLHNPSARNAVVYVVVWSLQIARIRREERFLMQDDSYRIYAGRVRYRLVPGLY
jgi:protein-S-isoprenylcysteine O-methyltransferase Ste14